jgi:hypothetical protein
MNATHPQQAPTTTHATTKPAPESRTKKPVRAAVFSTLAAARKAVKLLQEAGFAEKEITVICSDETKERHFKVFEHQQPAGANTPAAAAIGGTVGATIFGLASIAAGAATGGVPLIVLGGWALATGGVLGGFVGAMMTRGFEREAANYYDQAVIQGQLLVVVEHQGPQEAARMAQAEHILAQAGSEPVALPEG